MARAQRALMGAIPVGSGGVIVAPQLNTEPRTRFVGYGRDGPIYGVVDSGADQTCLPFRFTALMGYTVENMRRDQGMSASGPMDMWVAENPSSAHVVGLDEVELDLWPTFLPEGHVALWGRADLFRQFGILFEEEDQRLSLLLRE